MEDHSIDVSLPAKLHAFVTSEVAAGGYHTLGDYLVGLVAAERRRKAEQEVTKLILDGLNSGPPIEANEEYWESLRSRYRCTGDGAKSH